MEIKDLENKSILVLGLGREGLSTLKFIKKYFPGKKVAVADKTPREQLSPEVLKFVEDGTVDKTYLGEDYLKAVLDYEIIIKSPGISPHQPYLEDAFWQGKLTSGTDIFMQNCQGKVIGITGTKGKSTTASLIYQILRNGNLDVELVGNIGIPVLDYLEKDNPEKIFVFEMSSHQLLNLKVSPHIAVMTNIYPEHLDYYQSYKEYKQAKVNITKFQTKDDIFIFNQGEKELVEIAQKTQAKSYPFSLEKKDNSFVFKEGEKIVYRQGNEQEEIIKNNQVPLLGEFNLQNIMPGIIVGKIFNLPTEKIKEAIEAFQPLPHRLELVGTYKNLTFYNDSISTIPQTAAAAISALGKDVETLIVGGYDRNIDFTLLAEALKKSSIKNLILFPSTGEQIWQAVCKIIEENLRPQKFDVSSMEEAVKIAFKITTPRKICLLSPASSSFNLFKNYEERGNLFKKYVQEYGSAA